jgi:hypothetical protein
MNNVPDELLDEIALNLLIDEIDERLRVLAGSRLAFVIVLADPELMAVGSNVAPPIARVLLSNAYAKALGA